MPKPHLFISDRRSDAMEAVRGLYFQLRLRFGSGQRGGRGHRSRLPGREPVESATARDYPRSRLELRRGFRFSSFRRAITFLQTLVDPISQMKHHPCIENQWRTVFIHFTTWDIGNRISRLDVEAAELVDRLYAQAEK